MLHFIDTPTGHYPLEIIIIVVEDDDEDVIMRSCMILVI